MNIASNLSIGERFTLWDSLCEEARKEDKTELFTMFDTIREYVRNQRSICSRLEKAGQTDIKDSFPDSIYYENDHSIFGMDLFMRVVGSDDEPVEGETQSADDGVKIGAIRFEKKTADNIPEANVFASDLEVDGAPVTVGGVVLTDSTSIEPQVRKSLVDILRGYDRLSFVYTPYVMMISRATAIGMSNVWIDSDPGQLVWRLRTVVGDYVMTADLEFGAVKEYFNL